MPSGLKVEYAASGRAACRKCKNKIDKDAVRIGVVTQRDDFDLVAWYHLDCAPKKRGGGRDPEEFEGYEKLARPDREALERVCSASPTPKRPKVSADEPPKDALNADHPEFEEIYGKYAKLSIPELKEHLAANGLPKSGTKAHLVETCVDGELHGALPLCPLCGKGQLRRLDGADKGTAACPGYWDEEAGTRRMCAFKMPVDKVERRRWRDASEGPPPEPAQAGASLDKVDASDFAGLGPREKADKLAGAARAAGLQLPEDEAKARVAAGTALNATKTEDGDDDLDAALKELARKYPPAQASGGLKCGHPDNAKICELLKEYGDLMEKAGKDVFAVRGAKTALAALMVLERPIKSAKDLTGKSKVAGVGKGTADKIQEIVDTGTFEKLEELREEMKNM
mmetsp:Transcript_26696/g.89374  ORF Transcript_26696/g.89374 Transcript_26696/m.89374 type:complete len:398 (-) Transcript_26696:104-1297(-)